MNKYPKLTFSSFDTDSITVIKEFVTVISYFVPVNVIWTLRVFQFQLNI